MQSIRFNGSLYRYLKVISTRIGQFVTLQSIQIPHKIWPSPVSTDLRSIRCSTGGGSCLATKIMSATSLSPGAFSGSTTTLLPGATILLKNGKCLQNAILFQILKLIPQLIVLTIIDTRFVHTRIATSSTMWMMVYFTQSLMSMLKSLCVNNS